MGLRRCPRPIADLPRRPARRQTRLSDTRCVCGASWPSPTAAPAAVAAPSPEVRMSQPKPHPRPQKPSSPIRRPLRRVVVLRQARQPRLLLLRPRCRSCRRRTNAFLPSGCKSLPPSSRRQQRPHQHRISVVALLKRHRRVRQVCLASGGLRSSRPRRIS